MAAILNNIHKEADLDWVNTSSKLFPAHPSKEESTDIGTEKWKILGSATGIEPRASGYAHQFSDH